MCGDEGFRGYCGTALPAVEENTAVGGLLSMCLLPSSLSARMPRSLCCVPYWYYLSWVEHTINVDTDARARQEGKKKNTTGELGVLTPAEKELKRAMESQVCRRSFMAGYLSFPRNLKSLIEMLH